MTVLVPRLVTTTVFSATLSLFFTVLSITAMETRKLRWDGTFCTHDACKSTTYAAAKPRSPLGTAPRAL